MVTEAAVPFKGAVSERSTDRRGQAVVLLAMQGTDLRLVGTAASDRSAFSIAIIQAGSSGSPGVYREGDRIGELRIGKIQHGRVTVSTPGGELVLLTNGGTAAGAEPSQAARPPGGRVERSEIERTLPDYKELMQAIRFRAHFEGGRANGFVIYNIQPGSLFERMGIQNGDVIVSLNGASFKTTQPVMEFYQALKKAPKLSLGVKRGEGTRTLSLEIM